MYISYVHNLDIIYNRTRVMKFNLEIDIQLILVTQAEIEKNMMLT